MTNIEIFKSKENYWGFRAKGHANEGDAEEIVCAGISTLTQSLYFSLLKILSEKDLLEKQEDGFLEVFLKKSNSPFQREINTCFLFLETGLELLQENYPQYLTLNVMEVQR